MSCLNESKSLEEKINAGLFSRCVSRCVLIRNNPPIDAEGPASASSKPQAEELPPNDVIEPEKSEPAPDLADLDRVDEEVDRDYTHNLVGRLVKAQYWGERGTKYWATGEFFGTTRHCKSSVSCLMKRQMTMTTFPKVTLMGQTLSCCLKRLKGKARNIKLSSVWVETRKSRA